jgi:endonuclease/exonuclease/phosphatase family metal-dependent hydrolase
MAGKADLRVLTWNVFHGRDHPPDRDLLTWRSRLFKVTEHDDVYAQVNRPLQSEFAAVIAGAEWSVCLLQECPPDWAEPLAQATGAEPHRVLTSRNQLGAVRRALAHWNPDLIASGEGGSNLILVRPPWQIVERGAELLNPLPRRGLRERRRIGLVTVSSNGAQVCVANLHATAGDQKQAEEDVARGAFFAVDHADGRPLVLGGDFNLRPRESRLLYELRDRLDLVGPTSPDSIDHLLVRELEVVEPPRAWPPRHREVGFGPGGFSALRLRLSDHAPVEAAFRSNT